jgi:hypothetical protein
MVACHHKVKMHQTTMLEVTGGEKQETLEDNGGINCMVCT